MNAVLNINQIGKSRFRAILLLTYLGLLIAISSLQAGSNFGGYGELHFNKPTLGTELSKSVGKLDFHRFVLFVGHDFNEWISFHSELEVEHTLIEGEKESGEVALEQAFINLQYKEYLALRAGLLLVPVGIINPVHEPPTFNGVERPNVEKYIIPSTWRENGIGLTGVLSEGLKYEAYLMAGLNPDNLSAKNGIRGARQSGFNSSTQDYALTGRLEYTPTLNLKLGASGYISSLEKSAEAGGQLKGARIAMAEIHALFSHQNFRARGLMVYSRIASADKLNRYFAARTRSISNIGDSQLGAYAEASYDFLGHLLPQSEQRCFAFARFEIYNTQQSVTGFSANPDYERQETTVGFTYLPTSSVALKADYQFFRTSGDLKMNQFNLGMGYNF